MDAARHINIRFYGALNDFLPTTQRDTEFEVEFKKERSIKDLIESIGVPHPEIDVLLVDGKSVEFSYLINGGEHIQAWPAKYPLKVSPLIHNQPPTPDEPRFVLDVHLGRLAGYLRMLGFDTLYRNDYDDAELADISAQQQRILVTSDRRLLMRKQISLGYFMRSRKPREQIIELLQRYDLFEHEPELARCLACNGIIHAVDKQDIVEELLPLTKKHYEDFYQCDSCKKIYWEGSHFDKMQDLIGKIKAR
ncbi:MAG: Mut7-C RNAse domain-containing protein [Chromatiales bacterium]|jgi:uncharacterized protein with PIN domain